MSHTPKNMHPPRVTNYITDYNYTITLHSHRCQPVAFETTKIQFQTSGISNLAIRRLAMQTMLKNLTKCESVAVKRLAGVGCWALRVERAEWPAFARSVPATAFKRQTRTNVHRGATRPHAAFKCARFCRNRVTRRLPPECNNRTIRGTRTNCLTQLRFCAARNAPCINPGVCQQQIAASPRWHALCNPPGWWLPPPNAVVPRETHVLRTLRLRPSWR